MFNYIKIFIIFAMWFEFSGSVIRLYYLPPTLFLNSSSKKVVMKTKRCLVCEELKTVSEFNKDKKRKDGLQPECKICHNNRNEEYSHTKKGLVTRIYASQKLSSKHRNHPPPSYSKQELKEWLFSQNKFHELFDNWKISGFQKMLVPSCDRKDDYKPYTLDNIQLMTWHENESKGYKDRKNGINNKHSKAVLQFTKDCKFVKEYYSIISAERETGIYNTHISGCCSGKRKSAGGYIWKYRGE